METDDNWLLGFMEGQSSFSVNIGLISTKNKRYVLFKPYIIISNADIHQLNFIINYLGLESKVNKKKKRDESHNECYSLNIQNFNDIDIIIHKLLEYKFKSDIKQQKFVRFAECYAQIVKMKYIHTKWDDKFIDIVDRKLKINSVRSNIDKNRFGKDDWVKKIQEHLTRCH